MSSPPATPNNSQAPNAAPEVEVPLYASRQKIYPRSVLGLFTKWRWVLVWLTQIIFYGLPWLQWNARQAILFDLEARRFYIFGLVLYPQDFIYLTGLLVISALALFLFTAVAGRLWCGYACPQTVYTEIFLWIEHKVEGDRSARMRLDQADFSAGKFGKKWLKHFLWVVFSLWTGFTFVGYFSPIRELGYAIATLGLGPWESFWIFFYGFATYGNAGFMREQVCKYMCPYARFQSAMFDKDTMVVTYDQARGEPRGARSKKADPKALGLGSCVDCTLCVQVCPTGIDIRNGLQYECIGCGACIDVCDDVMDKMGYDRGLIRYTSGNAVARGWNARQMLRRVWRPRVLIYGTLLTALTTAWLWSLTHRHDVTAVLIKDRGSLARMVHIGAIENTYRLQVTISQEVPRRFVLTVEGLPGLRIDSAATLDVGAAASASVPVRLLLPGDVALQHAGASLRVSVVVLPEGAPAGSGEAVRAEASFIVPR